MNEYKFNSENEKIGVVEISIELDSKGRGEIDFNGEKLEFDCGTVWAELYIGRKVVASAWKQGNHWYSKEGSTAVDYSGQFYAHDSVPALVKAYLSIDGVVK